MITYKSLNKARLFMKMTEQTERKSAFQETIELVFRGVVEAMAKYFLEEKA